MRFNWNWSECILQFICLFTAKVKLLCVLCICARFTRSNQLAISVEITNQPATHHTTNSYISHIFHFASIFLSVALSLIWSSCEKENWQIVINCRTHRNVYQYFFLIWQADSASWAKKIDTRFWIWKWRARVYLSTLNDDDKK